jgi:glycosyltransferase involved in cell wall biosynthesis
VNRPDGSSSATSADEGAEGAVAREPVRVLRVVGRLNVGGPALHVSYLAAGLDERGYRTTLVAGDLARGEASMEFVARDLGVSTVAVTTIRREPSPLRDALATVRLAQLIRRERPHVVHTHTAKAGALGRVATALARLPDRPVVVHTFHGHVLRGYFGPVRSGGFRLLERLLASLSDALVAVSPEVRDDLVALGVAPRSKFAVVRLGIELEQRVAAPKDARVEARTLLGVPPERFLVGWLGRMTGVKRTEDVLLALARLRGLGVDAALCMVGDGPDREALEEHAHRIGVARHVLMLGYQEDVARWYAAFDAIVLPSGNEGTPVSVIEALAARTPVVATRVGGVPDVVRDGVDGFLVPASDVDAVAERLALLAGDPELRDRMGEAGRARVLARYAVDRLVGDVDRLYRSLLDATPTARDGRR